MKGGRGHFDFALLPEQFDAGIFDLWAVNLLSALSKQVDDESGFRRQLRSGPVHAG